MKHTFFFKNLREREAQNTRKRSKQDASANMLRQTVTLATAIFLFYQKIGLSDYVFTTGLKLPAVVKSKFVQIDECRLVIVKSIREITARWLLGC